MEVDICLDNPRFPWIIAEGKNLKCWLKGDLFLHDTLLDGPGILSLFSSLPFSSGKNTDALNDLTLGLNGSFALVIEAPDHVLCIVDRVRSIPLFYGKTGTRFIVSDDANVIKDRIQPPFNTSN
ncbi:MAG: hypothetical protein WCB46_07550, partial [Methanoregula sp.]